ncbi:E3 ubiquitin-protein ligase RBBP6 isoform X6 [Micropterus salmoides]|uniref:E3 ubiquitin-protein ligase RBBP6 isoform X6 n=1 Tax=Micropterus salmoides TaxID=27706 RepID=UPI0018EB56BB|nr:E3 ubiquitin-protein ligase RBBP6 isoform X6 [Micropterus salmoides]
MGTQGTGRKRSTKKERSTAEDDALNLIAREAEARLAAKRAARAEAREIRMKELERQQKELSDDDERMSVGSRGSVRSDLDAVGAYGGGDSPSHSHKKSKKKKKHKHKDRDRNGCDDDYSVISSRSSRLSDESRVSRSSRLDLTSSRLSDDNRMSRASRLDLQPVSYASSDLYSFNGLSSSRNPGSAFNGYQSSAYEDGLSIGPRRVAGSHPLEYTSYRSSNSRASSRASSARASPVDNCSSVASFLRSAASSSGLPRDLDDVTIPDFSDVEDRDYLEKGSRAASAITAATLTSLGGTSSRRGSGETAINVDAETSIREIKEIHELKDQIQDVETKYTQNLKEVKDALAEVEEKYRKAMVSNAQLDNEKNNLMYQVDTLKDSLMELEELLSESRRGYEEKVKEFEREKHAHSVLQFQFNEMKETLKQSEELLNEIRQLRLKQEGFIREISDLQETVEWKDKKIGALERQKEYTDAIRIERDELREEVVNLKDILKKHGIVLGPDLNINGDGGEAEVEGSPSADPASQPTQDSQTSPTEGNSMLGNTEDTQLRSSGEEEVDPEQHQEMVEEAEENHLNSDSLCNVADVPVLETSSEEQQTCLATEEDNVEESGLSKDLNVDIDDRSITEAKDINVCSPGLQGIVTSSEENVPETETPEGGDVVDISNPDLGETQTTSSSVETHSVDRESCNDFLEEQDNKGKDVERNSLSNTESCPQQKVAQDVMKESLPDGSVRAASNTEPQQEPENDRDAENDGAAEISNKSLPQGASASGKKKKKKRRSKKKGGTHEDKEQQKDGTATKKGKIEEDIESAAQDNETEPAEPDVENLKELRVVPVKNEQATQETEEVDRIEAVHPTENWSHNEPLKESRVDHVSGEQDKEQSSETENIEEVEAVATTETFSHTETPNEIVLDHVLDEQNKETGTVEAAQTVAPAENFSCGETLKETCTDPKTDEQDKEQTLESKMVEAVGSPASPVPETNLSTCDPIDNSKRAESSHGLDKMCTSSVENSKSEADISTNVIHTDSEIVDSVEGESGSVDGRKSECTTSKPKNTFERNGKENTEAQSQVPSHGPSAADESKSTNNSETNNNTSVSLCSTDGFTDGLKSLSGSEPPSELSATVELGSEVPDRGPEEATVTVKDDEEPGAETEQESFSASASHDGDNSGLKAEKEELSGDLREAEGLAEPDSPSLDEKRDSCASLTKNTDAIDGEKSLLETAVQVEELDDVKSQTLQCEDPIDESNAAVSSETEEIDTINTLNTPDSPKEATEIGSSIKQDHSTEESAVEDPEHNNSQKDQQSETPVCPSAEQLHEPSKDESGENDASQPTLEDSDEGGVEDEEGQSFDFDDVDMEAAIVTHLSKNPKKEEVEEGVEVMLDDSSNGSSELCQRNTESNESTPDEPESNAEKCTVDGGHQIDTLDKASDTVPQDNQHSSADEEAPSENACEKPNSVPEEDVGVAEEPGHIIEEGHVLNVGEVAVDAENINQAVSSPIEEGLDAMKHELQGEDLVLPNSADQVASNKEPPQTGKDAKKNSKRGKGKAKEDCKMS